MFNNRAEERTEVSLPLTEDFIHIFRMFLSYLDSFLKLIFILYGGIVD